MTRPASTLFTEAIQAPYPGLRPFQPHESSIFFGRGEHVADMLTVLENHRFLAVVGPSGGGKSSLVRAGLLPELRNGKLLTAHSDDWRFVVMQPGDEPYLNLARAMQRGLWPEGTHRFHDGDPRLTDLVLRGSPSGFVDAVLDAAVPESAEILLVVDQFEELFRFRSMESVDADAILVSRRDDAASFAQLLLETAKQMSRPVYVMLTMRTDFLGECDVFDNLPEAINRSQYLTPRLNLKQLEEVIVRPLQQPPFRGTVDAEVVRRILNDVGSGRDELPVVQHVLFRTWQKRKEDYPDEPVRLMLADYEKVGGLKTALSEHADEALNEFKSIGRERLVEKVFCCLCARGAGGQGIRRPATIQQIADESGFSTDEVLSVVKAFHRPDRSFLTLTDATLTPATRIDVSHESLLRQWTTLRGWIDEEARSAATFIRLRDAAFRWPTEEPLLQDPALSLALNWRQGQQPLSAWAKRYGGGLDRTLDYLSRSEEARERENQAAEDRRLAELHKAQTRAAELAANAKRFRIATIALAGLLLTVALAVAYGWVQQRKYVSLNKNVAELQNERTLLQRQQQGLANAITTLGVDQRRLARYNEALAAIGFANGTVTRSQSGTVSVVFNPGNVSPDSALALLDRIGGVKSLILRGTSVSDAGLKSIQRLPDLQSLDLSFTEIGDHGIAAIADMRQLADLSISDVSLTESGISELTRLINLKTLDVSRNRVSGAAVGRLRARLDACQIKYDPDPLLEALARFHGDWRKALKSVRAKRRQPSDNNVTFFDSAITDAALRALAGNNKLTTLELRYCYRITNEGLKYIGRIPNLKTVVIGNCSQISDSGAENLASKIGKIESLTFDSIALTDRGLRGLSEAGTLTRLEVSGNGQVITDDGVAFLARLSQLEYLSLGFNRELRGESLVSISKLSHLRTLVFMDNTGVPASAYAALSALHHLQKLDISFNEIADEDLKYLENLKQLDVLICGSNITEEGMKKLQAALPKTTISRD